jgi:hypothetical protein
MTENKTVLVNGEVVRKDALLMELHRGTRAIGFGVLQDNGGLSLDEARAILDERDWEFNFDYVKGRPLKCFERDGLIPEHCEYLYNRDAGPGAFAAAAQRARSLTTGEFK